MFGWLRELTWFGLTQALIAAAKEEKRYWPGAINILGARILFLFAIAVTSLSGLQRVFGGSRIVLGDGYVTIQEDALVGVFGILFMFLGLMIYMSLCAWVALRSIGLMKEVD